MKGLSGGGGAVHRREELEVILQKEGAPRDWPAGAARDLVLRVAGDAPLQTLVDLRFVGRYWGLMVTFAAGMASGTTVRLNGSKCSWMSL